MIEGWRNVLKRLIQVSRADTSWLLLSNWMADSTLCRRESGKTENGMRGLKGRDIRFIVFGIMRY